MVSKTRAFVLLLPLLVPLTGGMRFTEVQDQQDSPRTEIMHWLGDDYISIEANAAEAKLRAQSPGILLPGEHVQMAFKVGRNKIYFTDARLLLRPKSAITGYQATFKSLPYKSIKAFAFETAGMWPDMDTQIVLYTNLPAMPTISVGFRKGTSGKKANVYEVSRFFAEKLLNQDVFAPRDASLLEMSSNASIHNAEQWLGDAMAWIGNDASQIDAAQVEKDLRETVPLLGAKEKVFMAFKVGRDTTLLTSRRLLRIDVQGLSGQKINFLTIPYEAMKAYMVQTAGHFDLDAEMRIWTDIPGLRDFKYDLRAGSADVKGIQALLSDMVLGVKESRATSMVQMEVDDNFDIFHWLSNNFIQVDPRDVEFAMRQQYILQAPSEEWVLQGFRIGRDVNVLTNKRLLMVDVKGVGKKVEYLSIPYHGIQAYSVQTAGYFDGDAELQIWTGISPPPPIPRDPPECNDDGCVPAPPPPPQCPTVPSWDECLSYFTFDLAAGRADLWTIQQVLSAHVLGFQWRPYSLLQSETVRQTNPVADLYHYMSDNAAQVDPMSVELQFKNGGILQQDEFVQLAFTITNDFHIWTSKRFLLVDRQGFFGSGRKVLYRSIPYHAIKGFAVTTAGMLDSDSELEFWTSMPWLSKYKQDLRNGQVNLGEIMRVLTHEVNTYRQHPALPGSLLQKESNPVGDAIAWLGGAGYEMDAAELDKEYHTSKPLLTNNEHVTFACKAGRDTTMLTTKRAFLVDVQGLTGSRVEYKSVPYASVGAFLVRSAGIVDVDTEMELFTTAPGLPFIRQNLRKGHADIFKVSDLLTKGVFTS